MRSHYGVFTVLAAMALLCVLANSGGAASGDTTRVSVASDGTEANDRNFFTSSISSNGRFVAFESEATNLVASDTNDYRDVFVHDRTTGTTERVNVSSSEAEADRFTFGPSMSSDGRFVAFTSFATNLVANDTDGISDVFVRDLQEGTTERVSIDSSGVQANNGSGNPSVSSDGRFVAFESNASNLVANDTNNIKDIFVHDRTTGATQRVSVDSSETEAANGFGAYGAYISPDGGYVAFSSDAANLVEGDTNNRSDIFVRDLQAGTTERVSVSSSETEANDESYSSSISSGGRYVAFESDASNLVANDTAFSDIFVRDRETGTTERVVADAKSPSISADGRYLAFGSSATNLVSGDTNNRSDIFVRDLQAVTTERVSVSSSGTPANDNSTRPSISPDGNYVSFSSWATNLIAEDDNNDVEDIFVHERGTTRPQVVSVDPAKGATAVPKDIDVIKATFSEEMKPESLNPSSFRLYQYNRKTKRYRQITDVEVTCVSPCMEAMLNPYPTPDNTRTLAVNKKYKAVITTGVRDMSGNALARKFSWTFTTEGS